MRTKLLAAAIGALAIASAPVAVSAAGFDRQAAPVESESELGQGAIINLLAVAAIIAGIVIVAVNEDSDEDSVSP